MNQDQLPYLSYLLRLWLEDDHEPGQAVCAQGDWRASLQDPQTLELQVFADMETLFDFLLSTTHQRALDHVTPPSVVTPDL